MYHPPSIRRSKMDISIEVAAVSRLSVALQPHVNTLKDKTKSKFINCFFDILNAEIIEILIAHPLGGVGYQY